MNSDDSAVGEVNGHGEEGEEEEDDVVSEDEGASLSTASRELLKKLKADLPLNSFFIEAIKQSRFKPHLTVVLDVPAVRSNLGKLRKQSADEKLLADTVAHIEGAVTDIVAGTRFAARCLTGQ